MRRGYKSSSGFQEGFEADIQVKSVLMMVQQSQLINEDGSQREVAGSYQAFGGHRSVAAKDAHDHRCFEKEPIRVESRSSSALLDR